MSEPVLNLRDELAKKAVEAVEQLIADRQSDKIDDAQLLVGLRSIFATTSGFLSTDSFKFLSDLAKEVEDTISGGHVVRRVFLKADLLTMLELTVGDEGFNVAKWRDGIMPTFRWVAMSDTRKTRLAFDRAAETLKADGYREITE